MTRCIHLGLLCVQESIARRPTMSSVVHMLSGHSFNLPMPTKPPFVPTHNKPLPATDFQPDTNSAVPQLVHSLKSQDAYNVFGGSYALPSVPSQPTYVQISNNNKNNLSLGSDGRLNTKSAASTGYSEFSDFNYSFFFNGHFNPWSHGCIDTNGNYTSNSTYKSNLDKLLTEIPIANISYGFYNFSADQQPDQANAIALCRGDVDVAECNTCLNFVITKLAGLCPNQKEAIGWADNCMLRYSNRSILGGQWENTPTKWLTSKVKSTDINQFANDVQELLRTLPNKTASGDSRLKFATGEAKLSDSRMVYALMQCTPDLPSTDCLGCLYWANYYILATGYDLRGQTGARVLLPSCNIRYDLLKFYSDSPTSITPEAAAAPSSLTS
ncbi:hypothetical protein V2J09_019357 [Rumex salicifolius]